jgi:hypoxanthine phosphoribosyltransferase
MTEVVACRPISTVCYSDEATILRRLDELAMQISADYRDRELTVIAILNGSLMFMADLLAAHSLAAAARLLSVASYHGGLQTSGEVILRQVAQPDVAGRHILLLDDILDSGTTINASAKNCRLPRRKVFAFCVLLRKIKSARGQLKQITLASISPTNLSSVMDSIMARLSSISPASAC